ncbi:DNA-binding protein YbiB [Ramlibacter sp. Leaf400]|uniref:DNA-binding protein YbiB n=1 Tax=Ramlibacter sp. Leaf400 TaxID=1736365 RepID=UPI0006F570AE|nr:DNA-binding protein YbiB [Ramlibacter sp. Leaf400]KQT10447.1 glycosyl transferase [Ramlibacter sp. Leaf400]
MGISQYLKEIGRGKQGARPLDRAQAADLFGQVLDGSVTDLEVGAFCLAMRIKGETPEEMAGFLDATRSRMNLLPRCEAPVVVLPSYNGARRLPVLTPLLALLLAQRGLPVLVHGTSTESSRVFITEVLAEVGIATLDTLRPLHKGEAAFAPTERLHPGLKRLLDVRRVVGLRNSSHSLVKLMDPCEGPAVLVGSYTHPEYAQSMGAVFELMGSTALLLRGTEGEAVADARRMPQMEGFVAGRRVVLQEKERGTLTDLPGWPSGVDAAATAAYIRNVIEERQPLPTSIALQVEHILRLASA